MPPIKDHQSTETTKVLYIGDSGSGKTGSLASLAAAGYNLRIIDMDNGLDILKNYLTDPNSPYVKKNPECATNCHFVTITDAMKNLNGKVIPINPTAWLRAIDKLVHWKDGDIDLGPIASWGPKEVLVIDSLSMLSTAALNYHLSINGLLGKPRTSNEGRRDIGSTQNLLRTFLEMIFDTSIKCNIILTSHITFVTEIGGAPNSTDGTFTPGTGYPSAIGRSLSPQIPRYFNTVLIAKTSGVGSGVRHTIHAQAQAVGGQVINAKSSAPLKTKPEYGIDWGLAEYFKDVRG